MLNSFQHPRYNDKSECPKQHVQTATVILNRVQDDKCEYCIYM